jgi:predicted esterase
MHSGSDYFDKYFIPADALYDAGEYAQAIALLEPSLDEFPEHAFKTVLHTVYCYAGLDQWDRVGDLIESSIGGGHFFDLRGKLLELVQARENGERLLAENQRLRHAAQAAAKMRYEVHLPKSYKKEERYPLLLTMHSGGGHIGNIETHRYYWKPEPALRRGFIVVYVQSALVSCSGGFSWDGETNMHRQELSQCYQEVLADYVVDTEKVFVGGFSAGGTVSIDAVVNDVLPAKGFIALGPDKPETFAPEGIAASRQRGCRGVILEGEQVVDNSDLQDMLTVFQELKFPYKLMVNQGIGHWYPEDLADKMIKALAFVLDDCID